MSFDAASVSTVPKWLRFDGSNFLVWKMKMKAHLVAKDLWSVVEKQVLENQPKSRLSLTPIKEKKVDLLNKAEVPESKLADIKKAQLAYSILLLSLADEQFPLVMQVPEGNANGVWEALVKHYESDTVARFTHA